MGESEAQASSDCRVIDVGTRSWKLLIDGSLVPGAATTTTIDPSTGQTLAEVPDASTEHVDVAVDVMTFADEAEAVVVANAVDFGLTASIWTRDLDRTLRVISAIDAGDVWVSEAGPHYWGAPVGGTKNSSVGREGGLAELLSYTEPKSVHVRHQPMVAA